MNDVHNPYAPPKAPVAGAEVSAPSLERPRQVKVAVQLAWAGLALGFLSLGFGRQWMVEGISPIATAGIVLLLAVIGVLCGLLNWKIWQGRNWARLVYAFITALGVVSFLPGAMTAFRDAPFSVLNTAIQLVMDCLVIYLVFTDPGKRWFAKRA